MSRNAIMWKTCHWKKLKITVDKLNFGKLEYCNQNSAKSPEAFYFNKIKIFIIDL